MPKITVTLETCKCTHDFTMLRFLMRNIRFTRCHLRCPNRCEKDKQGWTCSEEDMSRLRTFWYTSKERNKNLATK